MMNKFLQKSIGGLVAFCVVAPSAGYSFLYKGGEGGNNEQSARPPFYGALTPNMGARDFHMFRLTKQIDESSNAEAKISDTLSAGIGLNSEFGWKNCFRFKGRTFVSATRAPVEAVVIKGLFFDVDAQMTLFAPVSEMISMLITGGWEYKWGELKDRVQGYDTTFTSAILRLNGPFAGVGVNFRPGVAWTVESGINYHIPMGTGRLRAQGTAAEPQDWLANAHYRGGRFGISGYLEATWCSSKHWSMTFSLEGLSLNARGQHVGAPNPMSRESSTDVMSLNYVNYGFGLNYTF